MVKITDFILSHQKAFRILLYIGIFILIVSLSLLIKVKDIEINVVDRELNKRIEFCQDKIGYVLYTYTCEFVSDCSPIYVDCDLVKKWQLDYTYDSNGRFNYDVMREQFRQHQENKKITNVTQKYGLGVN